MSQLNSLATSAGSHARTPGVPHATLRNLDRFRPLRCVGNWQFTYQVATGSLTDVYLAKPIGCRPDWPADYAVKLLRPEFEQDVPSICVLAREALVGSEVTHPHLISILEAHMDEPPYHIVMPKLDGSSVNRVLEQVKFLSVRHALWITRQVAEALHSLHVRGWLHGDIKPSNIMVSPSGHATLIDLGFALQRHEAMLTAERTLRGTLNYLPPETMTSSTGADERSDVYSLGIALFEMLTGRLPFTYDDPGHLIEAHRGEPLPDPRVFNPQIGSEVVALLRSMTAKQPARRFQSASEVAEHIMPLEVALMRHAITL